MTPERGIRAIVGWIAACIFDAMLGLGIGGILVMPIALVSSPPTAPIHQLRMWIIGGVMLVVLALLVGGIQSFILRDWIPRAPWWGLLSGMAIIFVWPLLTVGALAIGHQLTGLAAFVECCVGIAVARFQSLLLPEQWQIRDKWFVGAIMSWIVAGAGSVWVELSATDPIAGVVFGFVTSRALYGALSGFVLGWLIWAVERRFHAVTNEHRNVPVL